TRRQRAVVARCRSTAWFRAPLAGTGRHAAHAPLRLRGAMVRDGAGRHHHLSDHQPETHAMNKRTLGRIKLISIFLLFIIPVAASYILYFGLHGLDSSDSANKGELLDPVQPLPALELNGADGHTTSDQVLREKWTYLQVAPAECGAACRRSEEHTSELQSRFDLVCRLLLAQSNERQRRSCQRRCRR